MKKTLIFVFSLALAACSSGVRYDGEVIISSDVLKDKIRGGWFAQTIGCTYGGPTEFKFKGGLMQDAQTIDWYDGYIHDTFIGDPGLYDDVYMDLTFLEVMSEYGIEAPASLYADRFANASYKLWHANQAARYNILNGIPAPESGFWKNNPHADDIDFQIEADFIGMITPGLPDACSSISDGIGHIMNYGDGWYGGVYIGAMYSYAYVCNDIPTIVREAASIIPEGTKFRSCIDDVIAFHERYPDDWKRCWFEIDKKHSFDVGCPEGVFNGFNIDAVINSAYVTIALLYGEGDAYRTMEIATRCGQDSDCNPASAFGILGVMNGFDSIPEIYRADAESIASMPFPYTSLSLDKACERTLELLYDVVRSSGGEVLEDGSICINLRKPAQVRYEQSFEGLRPVAKVVLKKRFSDEVSLDFKGNSIVVEGSVLKIGHSDADYVADLSVFLDGELQSRFNMPLDYITRKYEIYSQYGFESGEHTLKIVLNNPHPDFEINAQEMVVYDSVE